jgi:hypothetical protein
LSGVQLIIVAVDCAENNAQRLFDRPSGYSDCARRQPRAGTDALGTSRVGSKTYSLETALA